MICVQPDAPVEDWMTVRLGSEIASITESPFALPLSVRKASSLAEEMSMGFSPTVIEMVDGRKFVLNGASSFMTIAGYRGRDAEVAGSNYFGEEPRPGFVETPANLTYFVVDGDPGWRPIAPSRSETGRSVGWFRWILGG